MRTPIIIALALGLLVSSHGFVARAQECRHGISFTISHSPLWGRGRPVITKVSPHSPADKAGFKVGDIIEKIDGYSSELLSPEQITGLLQNKQDLHTLQTSNFGEVARRRILSRECKPKHSLGERELAELFSLYSIEDASKEVISYPYSYTQSASYPLLNAKTYSFTESDSQTAGTDALINQAISVSLEHKGLSLSPQSDLSISTYYQISPMEEAGEWSERQSAGFSWRYSSQSKGLLPLPVYSGELKSDDKPKYRLTLGIQIHSKRSKELVWSCEAKEYLSESISIAEYARNAVATMLTGFPFIKEAHSPRIAVHTLRYNYTGIIYSSTLMNRIVDVEDNSPAMKAGLRSGDIIRSINGQNINNPEADKILEGYFRMAERLETYRDKNLPQLEALVGNIPVSYWSINNYKQIARELDRGANHTAFAYLFAFRPYVLGEESKRLIFEVLRDGASYFVTIDPLYRDESTINIE